MFPNETAYARVFRNGLARAIWENITGLRTFNGDVVDIRNGDVRYFGLEDICDVVVKNGN